MLRLRSALVVIFLALLVGAGAIHYSNGLDSAATQLDLGRRLADSGLPALGSLLIDRAGQTYRRRAAADPAAADGLRRRAGECELALGRLFSRRGSLDRAGRHFERAQADSPDLVVRARAWAAHGQGLAGKPGATKILLGLVYDHPDDPLPAYLVGRLFAGKGRLSEARSYLQRSYSLPEGRTSGAALALARVLHKSGQQAEAADHATQALQLAQTEKESAEAAAMVRQWGGTAPPPAWVWVQTCARRHSAALVGALIVVLILLYPTWLGLLTRVAPAAAAYPYLLGRAHDPPAIRAYEAALRRWPSHAAILRALATAYSRMGSGATRAADLWERLYAMRPGDCQARDQVAQLALAGGRETEVAQRACQAWYEAHPDDPKTPAMALHLARTYRSRRDVPPAAALPVLAFAAEAAPADRDLQLYLAGLYSHYGRPEEACLILQAAVEAQPHDDSARVEYAHALIGAGRGYEAYRHLRILPPSPQVATDLYLAASTAIGAGRHHEGLRILEEVLRQDPGLFDAQERARDALLRVSYGRVGPFLLTEGLCALEAYVLQRATHPEHGDVLLLVFRRDFSDALEFPPEFARYLGTPQPGVPGCAEPLVWGSEEEEYYIAYPMPPGRPLADILEDRGPLPPDEAVRVTRGVLAALQGLHDVGRLHGDLRLACVWHDVQAGTTLIAAGASVVAEAAPTTTLPGARSPFQVAPEIVERGALSSAADLYAVGCMLYELLVGTPPLEGPTHLATIMAHVTLEPEPPSMRAPGIPEGLDEAVLSALAKDPADRPSSASTFADALEPFAATRPRDAAPVGTLSPEIPQEGVAPAPAPPEPADPRRWWTYYDGLERVTTGRWARIYRGRHRPSGELHAIKHLQVASAIDSTEGLKDARAAQAAWRLFQGEMRTLQWLSELQPSVPGLVPLREAYRAEEGHPAYAMPLFPECLGMRIERQGPLPEPEAVMLLMALAQTVGRLHDAEVAHRGISPRSVLLSADGQPHLGGFDTACRLTDQGPLLLAEREVQQTAAPPSATLGDVRFLSPERCRGEAFDHRTDIYSLGALLFYLLVGDAPFSRPDEMQVLLDHVSTPPPRLRACGVAASSVVQEVIDCAMAKAPEQRFSSTVALCSALTRT